MKKNILKSALCLSLSALVLGTSMSTTAFARYIREDGDAYVSDRGYTTSTTTSNSNKLKYPYNGYAQSYFNNRVSGFAIRDGYSVKVNVTDDKLDKVVGVFLYDEKGEQCIQVAKLQEKRVLKNSYHHAGGNVIHDIKGMAYTYQFEKDIIPDKYTLDIMFNDGTAKRFPINLI